MSKYILSCSSTVDLTQERLRQRNIEFISYKYYVDGKEYIDNFGQSMALQDFYEKIRKGTQTKTTQINAAEYEEYFEEFLAKGFDVVHLELSSGITGSINSARLAVEELDKKYPNNKVYLVDSLCISSGYGLFVEEVADLREQVTSASDLATKAEELRENIASLCFSTDLTQFIKGGRISKAAGVFGTLLKICPCMHADCEGKLSVFKKIPGKRRAMEEFVKLMEKTAVGGNSYSGRCYICNSDCIADAQLLKNIVEEKFSELKGKVEIFNIGTTIGSHTGPGTIALFYKGNNRVI